MAPSRYAKPVLEFLAFKLGVIDSDEILDHKRYFNHEELFAMFGNVAGMEVREHRYFQWRFNNHVFAVKAQ